MSHPIPISRVVESTMSKPSIPGPAARPDAFGLTRNASTDVPPRIPRREHPAAASRRTSFGVCRHPPAGRAGAASAGPPPAAASLVPVSVLSEEPVAPAFCAARNPGGVRRRRGGFPVCW